MLNELFTKFSSYLVTAQNLCDEYLCNCEKLSFFSCYTTFVTGFKIGHFRFPLGLAFPESKQGLQA